MRRLPNVLPTLSRSVLPAREVLDLFVREDLETTTEGLELEPSQRRCDCIDDGQFHYVANGMGEKARLIDAVTDTTAH